MGAGGSSSDLKTVTVEGDDDYGPSAFVIPPHLKYLDKRGEGISGVVAAFADKRTGTKVAVKKIRNPLATVEDGQRLLREITLMRLLQHEQLLRISDILPPPSPSFSDVYMIMPLVERDLNQLICAEHISPERCEDFTYQMLLGLAYLHSASVAHRDLSPANILVDQGSQLRICDFGLARVITEDDTRGRETDGRRLQQQLTAVVVTCPYRAPEVMLTEGRYGLGVDVWSAGCILAELTSRRPLFFGERPDREQVAVIISALGMPAERDLAWLPTGGVGRQLVEEHRAQAAARADWSLVLPYASQLARKAASELICFDPTRRITARDALDLPFFEGRRRAKDLASAKAEKPVDWRFDDVEPTSDILRKHVYHELAVYHPEIYDRDMEVLAAMNIRSSHSAA